MAGGIGSRFWPLSSTERPKQFLDILGTGQTLVQQTFNRFARMVPIENIYIITSGSYVSIVKEQLPQLPEQNIIAEPMRKNTAPCIAYICFKLVSDYPDASLVVAPADHQILDEDGFIGVCNRAIRFVETREALVTLGIQPTHPSTGYGYIQKQPMAVDSFIYPVKQYIEKPYLELAKSFLKNEEFLWNSGIFIWKISDVLKAYATYLPELYNLFKESSGAMNTDAESGAVETLYALCPNISIDVGIMEKSDKVFIIPSSFEWSDLGTWNSAWENMPKDYRWNAVAGKNVKIMDSANCVIHTPPGKMVIIQGLDDYIVADTEKGLLICRKDKEQELKEYVAEITRMPSVPLHPIEKTT
jgi:mannose-1-phosphate guanylyltransferase